MRSKFRLLAAAILVVTCIAQRWRYHFEAAGEAMSDVVGEAADEATMLQSPTTGQCTACVTGERVIALDDVDLDYLLFLMLCSSDLLVLQQLVRACRTKYNRYDTAGTANLTLRDTAEFDGGWGGGRGGGRCDFSDRGGSGDSGGCHSDVKEGGPHLAPVSQ